MNDVRACQVPLPSSSSASMSAFYVYTIGLRNNMRVQLTKRRRFTADCRLGPNSCSLVIPGCYYAVCKTDIVAKNQEQMNINQNALLIPRVRLATHFLLVYVKESISWVRGTDLSNYVWWWTFFPCRKRTLFLIDSSFMGKTTKRSERR